jgi:hypothetical protein
VPQKWKGAKNFAWGSSDGICFEGFKNNEIQVKLKKILDWKGEKKLRGQKNVCKFFFVKNHFLSKGQLFPETKYYFGKNEIFVGLPSEI